MLRVSTGERNKIHHFENFSCDFLETLKQKVVKDTFLAFAYIFIHISSYHMILQDEGKKASISLLHFNDPPPSASDLIPVIPEHICVNGLRMHGLQELELFLNPPSRGSMLNWEYVAAEFGFSNSKIMVRISLSPLLQEAVIYIFTVTESSHQYSLGCLTLSRTFCFF